MGEFTIALLSTIVGGIFLFWIQRHLEGLQQRTLIRSTKKKWGNSSKIIEHLTSLEKKLKGDWFDKFINLYVVAIKLQEKSNQNTDKHLTIFDLFSRYPNNPVAILGEPGAGKTTLVKKLAIETALEKTKIPVFIQMGVYSKPEDLDESFDFIQDPPLKKELLEQGAFLVIFDGLNEVDDSIKEEATRSIRKFIDRFPSNQYFLTCRTIEYPPRLKVVFREYNVLPLERSSIKQYLDNALGEERSNRIYSSLPDRVKEFCRNPLLLTMLTYICLDDERSISLKTKAKLYDEFLKSLYEREESLRNLRTSHIIRDQFITYIALKMNNEKIFIPKSLAQEWIDEYYSLRKFADTENINPLFLYHEILDLPPLKSFDIGLDSTKRISFMHQSFQEYYTAKALLKRIDEYKSWDAVLELANPEKDFWWETLILLSGILDDSSELIIKLRSYGIDLAERGDQRVITLTTRCIRDSAYVEPSLVDDVIIQALLAFKFGKVAFDFDLIYGAKSIREDQRSKEFPKRLVDDLNWWIDKYARVTPSKLERNIPIEILLGYLDSGDESLLVDTLFTLRDHDNRDKAISHLAQKMRYSKGAIREQLIVTIGYCGSLGDRVQRELIEIVKDTNGKETEWARAYALFALGKLGGLDSVQPMIEYMLDHNNPYRDSASWALQGLAKRYINNGELIEELKRTYYEALLLETDDVYGRYAKGNIVYSLGELDAREYSEGILKWLVEENDPYVLEDGVQAIGRLRYEKALPLFMKHLSNTDPVVRKMAIDGLATISDIVPRFNLVDAIKHLENDSVIIVREQANKVLSKLYDNR